MKTTIQVQLSTADQRTLAQLIRRLGWSPSRILREGLRLLAASHPSIGRARIVGMGEFCSRVPDLGSNKKHLRRFGR